MRFERKAFETYFIFDKLFTNRFYVIIRKVLCFETELVLKIYIYIYIFINL